MVAQHHETSPKTTSNPSPQSSQPAPLRQLAQAARRAARPLARMSAAQRSQVLERLANAVDAQRQAVLAANQNDLAAAKKAGLSGPLVDRLDLNPDGNPARFEAMVASVRSIAQQPDPLGPTQHSWTQDNGLEVTKVRIPLGVILMIYESRPNVTIDAAALCIRSGNAVILRGGSEAKATNTALAQIITTTLADCNVDTAAVTLVPTQDRQAIDTLLTFRDCIDLVIPRGGEKLIRRVVENSRIPVVQHYQGICHVYVDGDADADMAMAIVENSKVQRPGVCNAMETLLVDERIAPSFVPRCVAHLSQLGVTLRGCAQTQSLGGSKVQAASDQDWDTEFLDLVLAIKVVPGVAGAVSHIDSHGSNHTASIVTTNAETAALFEAQVDASCVLWNASTRFNDGGALGLGAEMGISTTRIHAYGPMGAQALTAEKFVVHGNGQVRQ